MDYTRLWSSARRCCFSFLAVSCLAVCNGGERVQPLVALDNAGGRGSLGRASGGSGGGVQLQDAGAAGSNCGDVLCRGAGKCEVRAGRALCVCDSGYVLVNGECVVDETCIQLRNLEQGCRQLTDREPALGIFFGLETCAGTTVRPDVLGDPNRAFKVLEDDNALGDESYVALFRRDVESYVSIALDLSGSLQQDRDTLVALIARLKQMVQSLQPAAGAPPVSVQLIVFGRSVDIARDFTSDFSAIAATLDAIQADPAGAIREPGGTNLFGAIQLGMSQLNLAQQSRRAATRGSVVTVGTLVTVTDGRDTSGGALPALDKLMNFISIGISNNIDDTDLGRVGPQGSFLAPTQADWGAAFDRVIARVLEYPQRSYLLAYCSPAVVGTHTVSVTLANRTTQANATCKASAAEFGVGVGNCNEAFISNYCASRSCASFLACGGCEGADAGLPDQWSFTTNN